MDADPSALQTLSSDYLSLLSLGELGMLSDVTFCIEGRRLQAHRCILAARSHFFRLMFTQQRCNGGLPNGLPNSRPTGNVQMLLPPPASVAVDPLIIPVDVVGFDAFATILRFLYSGQLILSQISRPATPSSCPSPSCSHSSCSYAVDLLLQLVHAAHFFGISELSELAQAKLGNLLEEGVSVESLMQVLAMAARKHRMQHIWSQCVDIVTRMGVGPDVLRRYLPQEVLAELVADARMPRPAYPNQYSMQSSNMANTTISTSATPSAATTDGTHSPRHHTSTLYSSSSMSMCGSVQGGCCIEEQKILRLQQALDCMDVELVRLMVMGEGLDLDRALALHYSVANCNREVVKALLELGVVDVNYSDSLGRTALHLAAGMGNAEMIAVLLDHHADPNSITHEGLTSIDILHGLMRAGAQPASAEHGANGNHRSGTGVLATLGKADQKRLHLCIELLQSAAAVMGRDEATESSCVTHAAMAQHHGAARLISTQMNSNQYDRSGLQRASSISNTPFINQKASIGARIDGAFAHSGLQIGPGNLPVQSIIMASQQYNQQEPAGSSPPALPTSLHHFTSNSAQITSLPSRISDINGEASSLISPRLSANQHRGFPLSCTGHDSTYPEILQTLQNIHAAENTDNHHPHHHHHHHQEVKSTNTASSSED